MIILRLLANLVLGGAALIEVFVLLGISVIGYAIYRALKNFFDTWNGTGGY